MHSGLGIELTVGVLERFHEAAEEVSCPALICVRGVTSDGHVHAAHPEHVARGRPVGGAVRVLGRELRAVSTPTACVARFVGWAAVLCHVLEHTDSNVSSPL